MYEILRNLPAGSFVLDLGSSKGSFPHTATGARSVRLDRQISSISTDRAFQIEADAAMLPFKDKAFAAVISNHSLEHFEGMSEALREIGRVVAGGGSLYVAVPDASTLTDRLYRWLSRGGGHVNAFTSAPDVANLIEEATGLELVATRTLYSSLSFLNRANSPRPIPKRLMLLGGGFSWSLFLYVWLSRRIDRWFGWRTSVYGWAFYFGNIAESVDTATKVNVCIRCGSGCDAASLQVERAWLACLRVYKCPTCGETNPFVSVEGQPE